MRISLLDSYKRGFDGKWAISWKHRGKKNLVIRPELRETSRSEQAGLFRLVD